jgi:hypothetical protein
MEPLNPPVVPLLDMRSMNMMTGDGSPVAFVASMAIAVILILAIALMTSVIIG